MLMRMLTIITLFLSFSCYKVKDKIVNQDSDSFGIYLTAQDIQPEQLVIMSYIEPAETPVVSVDDIIVYDRDSHSIVLKENAKNQLENLEIPVSGKSFLVCVDRQPKYAGAFWILISSIPFRGPVILVQEPLPDTIRIQLGYPEGIDNTYDDPRDHPDVMAALEKAGKL